MYASVFSVSSGENRHLVVSEAPATHREKKIKWDNKSVVFVSEHVCSMHK